MLSPTYPSRGDRNVREPGRCSSFSPKVTGPLIQMSACLKMFEINLLRAKASIANRWKYIFQNSALGTVELFTKALTSCRIRLKNFSMRNVAFVALLTSAKCL